MSDKELKSAYLRGLEAITRILYDLDPDGIGRSIDAPPDEYSDSAAKLMPRLWAARTESEASERIRRSFPTAERRLLDALWAARQEMRSGPAGSLFSQVTLSEEQLRAGLVERVDGVHIPWDPMAMTGIRAAELGAVAGISFQGSFDDLDEGYFAVLEFTASFGVMLRDYPRAPTKGTVICTDPMGQHSMNRLEIILEALHLSHDQLTWTVDGLE
jgi:hypothetical protein